METTTRDKINLLEKKLWLYNNTVYDLGVDARAMKIVENKQGEENIQKEISKNLKIIDFLKEELSKEKTNILKEVEENHQGV